MVSLEDSHAISTPFPTTPPSSAASAKTQRSIGRSMRTIRSNLYDHPDYCIHSFPGSLSDKPAAYPSQSLTDSFVDFRLSQLAAAAQSHIHSPTSPCSDHHSSFLDLSQTFSDYSACSSDISGELQRLAIIPNPENGSDPNPVPEIEPCLGFLERESFSTEIIESISPEDLQPTVKICIDGLQSNSVAVKRSAAAKLRLLAKNRSDYRVLIGESGAVPALIPLLRCTDPFTQEHAVTALLNLSLHESNRGLITNAGAIKSLIYVLKTGTETSKQNAACALLSLSLVDENKMTIGACGAIPPLVGLLIHGSCRGKKDALTTLYKLCSARVNKERVVRAGAVGPLVGMVGGGSGVGEKAMVVLSSLAAVEEGKRAIVEEGGIGALVEVVEEGSVKGKEFAVLILVMLCGESAKNRGVVVREGGMPPLVALSQNGTVKAKHKVSQSLSLSLDVEFCSITSCRRIQFRRTDIPLRRPSVNK